MFEIKASKNFTTLDWAAIYFRSLAGEKTKDLADEVGKSLDRTQKALNQIRLMSDENKQVLKDSLMNREFEMAEARLFASNYIEARQHSMALMAHLKLQKERQAFMTEKPDQAGADLNDNKEAELSDIDTETLRARLVQKTLAQHELGAEAGISEDSQPGRTDRLSS